MAESLRGLGGALVLSASPAGTWRAGGRAADGVRGLAAMERALGKIQGLQVLVGSPDGQGEFLAGSQFTASSTWLLVRLSLLTITGTAVPRRIFGRK